MTRARPRSRWVSIAVLAGTIAFLIPAQAQAVPRDRAAALEAYLVMAEDAQKPTGWTGSVEGCLLGTEPPDS